MTYHVNRINKIKAKSNPYSNPDVYKSNNPHSYCCYCKETGYLNRFRYGECKERKFQITVLFHNGAKFDFKLIIE